MVTVRSAEWLGCLGSHPGALAHDHLLPAAPRRWISRALATRIRTVAVGQLFDQAHLAAVQGRLYTLALGHAARSRNKSRPWLVALALPCADAR